MSNATISPMSKEQSSAWVRGLLAVAWADGHFDEEEREAIADLVETEANSDLQALDPVSPQELAEVLGDDDRAAHNFLRTAVMVAIADGVYTPTEDEILHQFCQALGLRVEALDSLRHTLEDLQGDAAKPPAPSASGAASGLKPPEPHHGIDVLAPTREWLDGLDVHDPKVARFLCRMIPSQCPFERDVKLFGRKIVHIPPMCKLNPLYEQMVGLRFRALSYLADDCGEDVSKYL